MIANLRAPADAIAVQVGLLTATLGTATETATATASLPDGIGAGPALIVTPPQGELSMGISRRREDVFDYPVRLLRIGEGTTTKRTDWLYAWAEVMRGSIDVNMDLGLTYVAWARAVALDIELNGGEYEGAVYDLVELVVRVRFDVIDTDASV